MLALKQFSSKKNEHIKVKFKLLMNPKMRPCEKVLSQLSLYENCEAYYWLRSCLHCLMHSIFVCSILYILNKCLYQSF